MQPSGSQLVLAVGADALFGAMTGGDARVFLEQAASGTGISRRHSVPTCRKGRKRGSQEGMVAGNSIKSNSMLT